ncbi:MAG: SIMPL domain-containing protein [Bdellovibrionales bacterium]
MMSNRILACATGLLLLANGGAQAEEPQKIQDTVTFTLSAEDWISTKTARVMINVEAAVSGNAAATARGDMLKAVENLAKTDWKLTGFTRSQDQTGLERWSASFEARLPENTLGGLHDAAKKAGKAGMQLSVAAIDFSPTLDETETTRAALRTKIYKNAADQLTALNAALPGRNYRIAEIILVDEGMPQPYVVSEMMGSKRQLTAMASSIPTDMNNATPMERSEKISVSAMVKLAAVPPQAPVTGVEHKR